MALHERTVRGETIKISTGLHGAYCCATPVPYDPEARGRASLIGIGKTDEEAIADLLADIEENEA